MNQPTPEIPFEEQMRPQVDAAKLRIMGGDESVDLGTEQLIQERAIVELASETDLSPEELQDRNVSTLSGEVERSQRKLIAGVQLARVGGVLPKRSWKDLGKALNTSRQAAWERFTRLIVKLGIDYSTDQS